MKKIIFVFFLIVFNTNAQSKFTFEFDYAQFKYDSTSNYLEVYYSLNQNDLTVINENGKVLVKALMYVQIQNLETDELIVNKNWTFEQSILDSNNESKAKTILGAVGFIIKHGMYKLTINIKDVKNDDLQKDYIEQLQIRSFTNNNFGISDIELASRIINENANKSSIFYKNTLEVFPNPSMLYTKSSPVLFYYAEVYNFNSTRSNNQLELKKKLFSSQNEVLYESSKNIGSGKESIVDVGAINLQKYPTGTYTLSLTLSDKSAGKVAVSSKKFFMVNPDVVVKNKIKSSSDYLSSEFGVYLDSECDDLFEKSKIIAVADEIKKYKKLDSLNSKRKFLYRFWKRRDTTPETENNELKLAYFERVKIANSRYRTMNTNGFKTDRGRVFLRYGEPDEIERHPNETNTKPYEVWLYNHIEGGVSFIFGDVTGFNYYELLHSNKRGELQDPNWQRRITQ